MISVIFYTVNSCGQKRCCSVQTRDFCLSELNGFVLEHWLLSHSLYHQCQSMPLLLMLLLLWNVLHTCCASNLETISIVTKRVEIMPLLDVWQD